MRQLNVQEVQSISGGLLGPKNSDAIRATRWELLQSAAFTAASGLLGAAIGGAYATSFASQYWGDDSTVKAINSVAGAVVGLVVGNHLSNLSIKENRTVKM